MEARTRVRPVIRLAKTRSGLLAPQQLDRLRAAVPVWLEHAENGLMERFRGLLSGPWEDLQALDRRIAELDAEIERTTQDDQAARRLQQLRGVGPIIATALVATPRWVRPNSFPMAVKWQHRSG